MWEWHDSGLLSVQKAEAGEVEVAEGGRGAVNLRDASTPLRAQPHPQHEPPRSRTRLCLLPAMPLAVVISATVTGRPTPPSGLRLLPARTLLLLSLWLFVAAPKPDSSPSI